MPTHLDFGAKYLDFSANPSKSCLSEGKRQAEGGTWKPPRGFVIGVGKKNVLQCVVVCCSALQCVAVCCSVLQWLVVLRPMTHCNTLQHAATQVRGTDGQCPVTSLICYRALFLSLPLSLSLTHTLAFFLSRCSHLLPLCSESVTGKDILGLLADVNCIVKRTVLLLNLTGGSTVTGIKKRSKNSEPTNTHQNSLPTNSDNSHSDASRAFGTAKHCKTLHRHVILRDNYKYTQMDPSRPPFFPKRCLINKCVENFMIDLHAKSSAFVARQ